MTWLSNNGLASTVDYCPGNATSIKDAVWYLLNLLTTAGHTHVASNDGTNYSAAAQQITSAAECANNNAYFFLKRPAITAGIGAPGNDIFGVRRGGSAASYELVYVPPLTTGLLYKTGGGTAWNAGASSVETIPANTTGYIEVTVESTHAAEYGPFIGLSQTDADQSYASVGWGVAQNLGVVDVYETSTEKGPFALPLIVGDKLRITRTYAGGVGTITYQRNGVTFYTSLTTTAAALIVDSSINVVGTFSRVELYVAGVRTPITWTNAVNCSAQVEGAQSIVTAGTTTTIPVWPIMFALRGTLPDTAASFFTTANLSTARYSMMADNAAPFCWYFIQHGADGFPTAWIVFDVVEPGSYDSRDNFPVVIACSQGVADKMTMSAGGMSAIATINSGAPQTYWRHDYPGEQWVQAAPLPMPVGSSLVLLAPGGIGMNPYGTLDELPLPVYYGAGGYSGTSRYVSLQQGPCFLKGRSHVLNFKSGSQPNGFLLKRQTAGDRWVWGDFTLPGPGAVQVTFTP